MLNILTLKRVKENPDEDVLLNAVKLIGQIRCTSTLNPFYPSFTTPSHKCFILSFLYHFFLRRNVLFYPSFTIPFFAEMLYFIFPLPFRSSQKWFILSFLHHSFLRRNALREYWKVTSLWQKLFFQIKPRVRSC